MARIRTIKPEFWSHPVMSKEPAEARLLAIALLNLADDEGYFLATPALVRSFAFPLDEDSTNARRALARLSDVGWIEVREHPSHGPVGMVVNFAKHQRIDRPSPSRIKVYHLDECSTNARRMLDDDSTLDQGTREQGNKGTGKGVPRGKRTATLETECVTRNAFRLKGNANEKKAALRAAIAKHGVEAVDAAPLDGKWPSDVMACVVGAHQEDIVCPHPPGSDAYHNWHAERLME